MGDLRQAAGLAAVRPIFFAVTTTVVPEAVELDESQWAALEQLVVAKLSSRPKKEQRQLRLFLRVVQWLPMFRYGRRFSSLDLPHRCRFLAYLQDHSIPLIRSGFWGLRTLALLGFYGRPEAAEAIGYRPDARGWDAHS